MTVNEHLKAALPEEYYHLALMNGVQFIDKVNPDTKEITYTHDTMLHHEADSAAHALEMLFSFDASPQRPPFWATVRDHLLNPEVALPSIP